MRTKKLSYKYIMFYALPKSYKREIINRCSHKIDDFPFVFYWKCYRFTFWTFDLPIEISNY